MLAGPEVLGSIPRSLTGFWSGLENLCMHTACSLSSQSHYGLWLFGVIVIVIVIIHSAIQTTGIVRHYDLGLTLLPLSCPVLCGIIHSAWLFTHHSGAGKNLANLSDWTFPPLCTLPPSLKSASPLTKQNACSGKLVPVTSSHTGSWEAANGGGDHPPPRPRGTGGSHQWHCGGPWAQTTCGSTPR